MIELDLQNFLRSGGTPEDLTNQYAIIVRRHKDYPNLVLFKYNQLDSPMDKQIVQEARGIILDENNNWNIVCFPYFKFFNYEEELATEIDWQTAKVYEKLDGSLCCLFWYGNQWLVSTSGSADASGSVHPDYKGTYADLFWKLFNQYKYSLPEKHSFCFMFELITKWNKVVISYEKPMLVLHGFRDLNDLKEYPPEQVQEVVGQSKLLGWDIVKSYPLKTLNDVIELSKNLKATEQEGFVVRDANFNRIKIKSPEYVSLSHIKDSMSDKRMVEIIIANESEEFLSYFPEYKERFYELKKKYYELIELIEKIYLQIKDIEIQKDFAFKALKFKFSGVLFGLRAGKVASIKEWLVGIQVNKLLNLLNMEG